jgi:hypothetical protein
MALVATAYIRGSPWDPSSSVLWYFQHQDSCFSMRRERVRPDPVSCQSCRSKKLKCNRVQPCSNCTARGIHCKFLVRPGGQANTNSTSHDNAELLERIARLESMVLKQTESNSHGTPSSTTSDDNHAARHEPPSLNPERITVSNIHRKRDQESRLLENVGTREDSLVRGLSSIQPNSTSPY